MLTSYAKQFLYLGASCVCILACVAWIGLALEYTQHGASLWWLLGAVLPWGAAMGNAWAAEKHSADVLPPCLHSLHQKQ